MVEKIYLSLTMLSVGVTLSFALGFLFLKIPESEFLRNYKKARYIISISYAILSVLSVLELTVNGDTANILFTRAITVIVSSYQAFFFSYTFICLLSPRYFKKNKIRLELMIISSFSIILLSTFLYKELRIQQVAVYAYLVYYCAMLYRYRTIFIRKYRHFNFLFDNYFSEENNERLEWVYYSFFSALTVGTGALLLSFSDNLIHYNIFIVVFTTFYTYFGIHFINYAHHFSALEKVIIENDNQELNNEHDPHILHLKLTIEKWLASEGFLQNNLTIESLSRKLNTNRTYLSNYLNNQIGMTFRDWVNTHKIEKAKSLLLENPGLSILDISNLSGYSDSSNFNKQFVKHTGSSARKWQSQQVSKLEKK